MFRACVRTSDGVKISNQGSDSARSGKRLKETAAALSGQSSVPVHAAHAALAHSVAAHARAALGGFRSFRGRMGGKGGILCCEMLLAAGRAAQFGCIGAPAH